MKYFLIDASSYVAWALEGRPRVDFMAMHESGAAFLYMPQFCVTEVMSSFSRIYYFQAGSDRITKEKFKKLCADFAENIHERKKIYIYDLHRYHNIVAEKKGVFAAACATDPNIGVFDILLISMAMELNEVYKDKNDEIEILSEDRKLCVAARELGLRAHSIGPGGAK